MNQSMQRSKVLSLNRRNSLVQDDDLVQTMRTNSSKIPIPFSSSSEETKKLIQRLQKLARDQKQKRQEIQVKYEQFKQRTVSREREFYRILSKFDPNIPGDGKEDNYDNYVTEIYNKILCTFEAFNQKARSLLDDRYSELYRLMERRIDILMQKMDKELAKYRKVSLTERKQLQQAIREIGVIAAETQSENGEFRKKNEYMELRLKILKDEKKLLLQEITSLKAYIKEGAKISRSKNKDQLKNSVMNNEFWNNIQSIQLQKSSPPKTTHRRSLTTRKQRYQDKAQLKYPQQTNPKVFNPHQSIDIYKIQRQSVSQQNIITHLRQQLQRQKVKNSQLVKFSLQLQAKQIKLVQLVNSQIGTILTKASQNSQNSLIQSLKDEDIDEESQFSSYDGKQQVKVEGAALNVRKFNNKKMKDTHKRQSKPDLVIDTKNMTSDHIEEQLLQQQKKFSNFINAINKILQLPQNITLNPKSLINQDHNNNLTIDNNLLQISQNPQNLTKYQPYSVLNSRKTSLKQHNYTFSPQTIETQKHQHNGYKSGIKRYETQNKPKKNSSLFANYSPLDIMDITKSIEIK